MKRLVAGATAALALALAGQAQAQTAAPTQCGGQFTGDTTCTLTYGGGSIWVSIGMGTDPLGAGTVRLEADVATPLPAPARKSRRGKRARRTPVARTTVRKVWATCQAFGMYGVCGSGTSSDQDLMAIGTPLYCVVTARTATPGRFGCSAHSD